MSYNILGQYSTIIALVVATFGLFALIFNAIQLKHSLNQSKRREQTEILLHKQRTLEYVSTQFDRLAVIGAREEMAKKGDIPISKYLAKFNNISDRKLKEQKFLEYIYTFNRIGAGIYHGSLDKDIIFNLWAPSFFQKHWANAKEFLIEKRKNNENAYSFFDWLAKIECPKHVNCYPTERPRHYT